MIYIKKNYTGCCLMRNQPKISHYGFLESFPETVYVYVVWVNPLVVHSSCRNWKIPLFYCKMCVSLVSSKSYIKSLREHTSGHLKRPHSKNRLHSCQRNLQKNLNTLKFTNGISDCVYLIWKAIQFHSFLCIVLNIRISLI